MELVKYPRTHHIEGSRIQPGDEDLDAVPFKSIKLRNLIVEEKMDGANSAISFDREGHLYLQSRGHFLTGGHREKHFDLLKKWANAHKIALHRCLSDRYIAFGEWLYAKHTIFYDKLPHYWLEFDVYDRVEKVFLSTPRRNELFAGSPVQSVKVLHSGPLGAIRELLALMGQSKFISSNHLAMLKENCRRSGFFEERILKETDTSSDMEGLYIKVEEGGIVKERLKLVRQSFLSAVLSSESHWLDRPIIPNLLLEGADIFEVSEDEHG